MIVIIHVIARMDVTLKDVYARKRGISVVQLILICHVGKGKRKVSNAVVLTVRMYMKTGKMLPYHQVTLTVKDCSPKRILKSKLRIAIAIRSNRVLGMTLFVSSSETLRCRS